MDRFEFKRATNGEWKALGQCPVKILISLTLDASENPQRFDVGVESIEKVIAQPVLFGLIEKAAFNQIVLGNIENSNFMKQLL